MFVSVLLLQNLFVCSHALRRDAGSLQAAMDTGGSFTMSLTGAETNVNARNDSVGSQNRSTFWNTHTQLPSSWKTYVEEGRTLGKGAFGIVKEVSVTCPGAKQATRLAVKQMRLKSEAHRRNATNEKAALESMSGEDLSPFIVAPVVPPTWTPDFVYFVTPLYEVPNKGPISLETLVDHPKEMTAFGGNQAIFGFLLHAAKGLEALHKANRAHLDVKPANVMVSCEGTSQELGNCHASIIDLGLSLQIGAQGGMRGTPDYMAPEICRKTLADGRSDTWSFGIMVWEMFYGLRSLPSNQGVNRVKHQNKWEFSERIYCANMIAEGWVQGLIDKLDELDELDELESKFVKNLLQKSLVTDIGSRLNMNEIINLLKTIAPQKMQGSFPTPSVKTAECLSPMFIRAAQLMPKGYSCCYYKRAFFAGKNSHTMVAGATCDSAYKKKFDCPLDGCESCWDECCKTRHPLLKFKCTGAEATEKRSNECRNL